MLHKLFEKKIDIFESKHMLFNHQTSDMKKLLLTFCIGTFFVVFASANNANLFSYNSDEVNQELSQLQNLEDYVSANPGITLTGLQSENNGLVANLNLNLNNLSGFPFAGVEPPLGIPSFLWGCVFGVVGVALVYFMTDEDKDETKKALIGCVVAGLSYSVFWVIYYLAWGSLWLL